MTKKDVIGINFVIVDKNKFVVTMTINYSIMKWKYSQF